MHRKQVCATDVVQRRLHAGSCRPHEVLFIVRSHTKSILHNYFGATEDFNISLKIDPEDTYVCFARANAKSRLQDYNGAIDDYNMILEIDPKNASAYFERGLSKTQLGQQRSRQLDFCEAFALGYFKQLMQAKDSIKL